MQATMSNTTIICLIMTESKFHRTVEARIEILKIGKGLKLGRYLLQLYTLNFTIFNILSQFQIAAVANT